MDFEQEGFIDIHARERLAREMFIKEKEKAKRQKKLEEKDWLKIISKGETYGSNTGTNGSEFHEE